MSQHNDQELHDPQAKFAVKVKQGIDVDQIAARHGFVNLGQVGRLKGIYLFQLHPQHITARDVAHKKIETLLNDSESFEFVEKQVPHHYVPRRGDQHEQGFARQ
eukprot:TRINITY_DN2088_c0_g6_i1.p1 TRINITY_DN2088_c0_g6~~TRINITY_DN2088_c0_g6_i1.p1  ORF type:complete len:104 (-),score=22.01 TRINITY_DN2088_c0_g6_i1:140-451(-)